MPMSRKDLQELYEKQKNGEITKLKYHIQIRGYILQDVANATGLSKRMLNDYYSGLKHINTMPCVNALRLAEFLEVDIYDLLERE